MIFGRNDIFKMLCRAVSEAIAVKGGKKLNFVILASF